MRIGVTGGIGSGKSTVASLLSERGAIVVDADVIARRVVERGSPVLANLVEEFGAGILDAEGRLNRAELARIAFADERSIRHLNDITHPAIREQAEIDLQAAEEQGIAVYEMPLLIETGQRSLVDLVVVVDVPEVVQIDRAVNLRGLPKDDVLRRMAAQVSRAERLDAADIVIGNSGTRDELVAEVDALWVRLGLLNA
jgi:dephospho-CoA kinase